MFASGGGIVRGCPDPIGWNCSYDIPGIPNGICIQVPITFDRGVSEPPLRSTLILEKPLHQPFEVGSYVEVIPEDPIIASKLSEIHVSGL